MALEEFEKDRMSEQDKRYVQRRSVMDIGMGILWCGMGLFVGLLLKKYNAGLAAQYGDKTLYAFGGLCLVYGLFRVWRGFKKNYLRER